MVSCQSGRLHLTENQAVRLADSWVRIPHSENSLSGVHHFFSFIVNDTLFNMLLLFYNSLLTITLIEKWKRSDDIDSTDEKEKI